ncbi:hypothetical protein X727_08045 [Mesorhizobium sp. L103C119B0]|nr:hypothetical protein X727_08045 [Mesorhizobium sp. L103C119B0]
MQCDRNILDGSAQAFASYQRERDFIAEQILDATDTIASFDWTLGDNETRHRQFSSVMKAEFEGIVERDMQARRFPRPWWQQRAEAPRSA